MMKSFWIALSFVLLMTPASAQTASAPAKEKETALYNIPAKKPDPKSLPVLANLMEKGAKVYYLGERSSLHGWFILLNGQVQILYATPDLKTTLIGALFTADGNTISNSQVLDLAQRDPEFNTLMQILSNQKLDMMKASQSGDPAATPKVGPTAEEPKPGEKKLPSVTLAPGELLYGDLKQAAGPVLGKNDKAELFMVMDTSCPHCHSTWKELRDVVAQNQIQVKLIPIAFPGTADEDQGGQLLRAADPLTVWNKHVDGDKKALEGKPDEAQVKAMRANHIITDKWSINSTPYLVYRGKDGRVKVVLGKPGKMGDVLADLVP